MSFFEQGIPLGEAAAFFVEVKGQGLEKQAAALDEFWRMPGREKRELLKEAGVSFDEFSALVKFAALQGIDPQLLLAQEQEGLSAQHQNESSFYQQRSSQLQEQMQQTQQQLQDTSAQMQALQQQVDGSTQQMQQAMQQSQMTEQAALTNVQAAHQAATQATQQALQATDEALKNQQLAAQMRMGYQGLRGDLMNLVSQDGTAQVGAQLSGGGMETSAPGGPGQQSLPASGATDPGANPDEGGGQGQGGPAAESASAQPPADAPPAGAPPNGTATSSGESTSSPSPADVAPSGAAGVLKESSNRAALLALGALLGGGVGAHSSHQSEDPAYQDALRQRIQTAEESQKNYGGFREAMKLTDMKSQLARAEQASRHPTESMVTGGLGGAGKAAGRTASLLSLLAMFGK